MQKKTSSVCKMDCRQLLSISAYWFATNLHWGALLMIVMPSQVAKISPTNQAQILSLVLGVGAIVALVTPPIVGAFSDRCMSRFGRRRPYMITGATINVIGLFVMFGAGTLRSAALYLAGYMVIQLGNNIAAAPYSGIIPDMVPQHQRGKASGYMAAMTQTGTVLGALGGGYLMGSGQVAASYVLIGATLLVFLAITVHGTRETPLTVCPPDIGLRDLLKSLWIDPRKHPDFAWVWITRALVTMGMWTVQPFIQYYLRDVIGVQNPEQQTGYLLGLILVGATFTGLIGGPLSDRIGRKRVVYAANSIIAAAAIAFLFGHSLEYTFIVGLIYGLGFGAYYSVDWALGCDVLPNKDDAAKDLGVWNIAMVLPQSLAPFISGPILQHFGKTEQAGHYSLSGYTVIFTLAALFLILGAVLLRNVRGTK